MEKRLSIDAWQDAEFRLSADAKGLHFTGYASVFDTPSEDLGGFREVIAPGAFANSLNSKRNIKMFLNHNWDILLASRSGKSLRLSEDSHGLYVDADIIPSDEGRHVAALLERGDIDKMSFGFIPVRTETGDPKMVVQREVHLMEVSPVTAWPAYPTTSASVRFLADLVGTEESDMLDAFRTLSTKDAVLTMEQQDVLMRVIRARSPKPYVSESTAALREQIARRMADLEARGVAIPTPERHAGALVATT